MSARVPLAERCGVTHPALPSDRGCEEPAGHTGDHVVNDACGRPEYYWHPSHWWFTGRDENGDLDGEVCRCEIGRNHGCEPAAEPRLYDLDEVIADLGIDLDDDGEPLEQQARADVEHLAAERDRAETAVRRVRELAGRAELDRRRLQGHAVNAHTTLPVGAAQQRIARLFADGHSLDFVAEQGVHGGWTRLDALAVARHRGWTLDPTGRLPRQHRPAPARRVRPRPTPRPAAPPTEAERAELRARIARLQAHITVLRARLGETDPPARGQARCGTRAGYTAHRRRAEPTCAACCAAEAAYKRAWKARRSAA